MGRTGFPTFWMSKKIVPSAIKEELLRGINSLLYNPTAISIMLSMDTIDATLTGLTINVQGVGWLQRAAWFSRRLERSSP